MFSLPSQSASGHQRCQISPLLLPSQVRCTSPKQRGRRNSLTPSFKKNPKLKLPLKGGFLNLNPNPPLYRKQTGGGLGVKWGKGRRREVYPGLTLSPLPFFGSLSQFLSFSPPNAKMKGEDRQCNTFLRKDSHHRRFRPIKYKSRTTLRGKYGEGNCPLLFFCRIQWSFARLELVHLIFRLADNDVTSLPLPPPPPPFLLLRPKEKYFFFQGETAPPTAVRGTAGPHATRGRRKVGAGLQGKGKRRDVTNETAAKEVRDSPSHCSTLSTKIISRIYIIVQCTEGNVHKIIFGESFPWPHHHHQWLRPQRSLFSFAPSLPRDGGGRGPRRIRLLLHFQTLA